VQLACVNLLDQRGLGGDAEKHDWHVQALTQPGRGIEAALTGQADGHQHKVGADPKNLLQRLFTARRLATDLIAQLRHALAEFSGIQHLVRHHVKAWRSHTGMEMVVEEAAGLGEARTNRATVRVLHAVLLTRLSARGTASCVSQGDSVHGQTLTDDREHFGTHRGFRHKGKVNRGRAHSYTSCMPLRVGQTSSCDLA